jgi:hypothetical protein
LSSSQTQAIHAATVTAPNRWRYPNAFDLAN